MSPEYSCSAIYYFAKITAILTVQKLKTIQTGGGRKSPDIFNLNTICNVIGLYKLANNKNVRY